MKFRLSAELWDVIAKLLTVNPGERPTVHDIVRFKWLKQSNEASPGSLGENTNSHPDPIIIDIMSDLGYNPGEIRESLQEKKFDQVMATYLMLKQQSHREEKSTKKPDPKQCDQTLENTGPFVRKQTAVRTGSSVPTLPTLNFPNEPESLEKGKRTTMSQTMPPTLNCFNNHTTRVHRIHRQLDQRANFLMSALGERENCDTSEETSSRELLEYSLLKIHPFHSAMDISKTGSTYSKIKESSQCVTCHHASVEEDECKSTNIPRGKMSPTPLPTSPQQDLMRKLHIVTTAGSMDKMNFQNRLPQLSSKKAKGEGPAIKERESRSPSPKTAREHFLRSRRQTAPQPPFSRRVWKTLKNGVLKGLRTLCCCLPVGSCRCLC